MAPAFREGHLVGDGTNWVPLWAQVTPLPTESGTPPANPLSDGVSANLVVYINQGNSTDLTQVRIGNSGDGRKYIATENGQAIAIIPISPGDPEPEILSPADVYVDFRLEVL